jgi:putative nucleotidyltransferase with HDIG domain
MKTKNSATNCHDLKFSQNSSAWDNSRWIFWLIVAFLFFILFIALHFREEHVDILELNSIAPRYIVAQVDFDFPDNEVSIIMKQEAVRDIGKVYKLAEKEIREKKRAEFENKLLNEQNWRRLTEGSSIEQMYEGLDLVVQELTQVRFTDPRTLQKMRELSIPSENYLIFTPASGDDKNTLPDHIWSEIQQRAFANHSFKTSVANYIVDHFESVPWKFDEDIPAQRNLRNRIQATVPEKYTSVNAGDRIIDQGEKVTTRHIAMLQAMKKVLSDQRHLWHPTTLLGTAVLVALFILIGGGYLYTNYPSTLQSNRKLFLLVTILILTLGLSKGIEYFLLTSKSNLKEIVRYPIFVPFAAILTCNLMNPSVAMFVSGFLTVLLTITLSFDQSGFLLVNLVAAMVAILTTHSVRRRKEIFTVCAKAWLACVLVILALHLYENSVGTWAMFTDLVNAAIFMLLTAVLVVGLLPLLETSFHIMTDATLMEYMDPNQDLLRRLSLEAPGTYQHSIVVGSLAESAALAIGANGLFCRVASLFHDVGKIASPQYFTENQTRDVNIHQQLTPTESARIIMAHVNEGVALAKKAKLPKQLIDIIREHHGTTLVYYFYCQQLEAVGGDACLVNQSDFRYPGPKPHSKESAIIMIADSIEAAHHSLDEVNQATITELIDQLVDQKADSGQFDDCLLTFEELSIVKKTLANTLIATTHSRVKYPSFT